jgi:hypothetical protein
LTRTVPLLGLIFLTTTVLPAATFTVTNTDPSGPGSLVQALLDADANPGDDEIAFDIAGVGPHSILMGGPYDLTTPVTIDGYTQPGSQANTNATGALNSVIQIELSGSGGNRCFGIVGTVTIRGIAFKGCNTALDIAGGNATIVGNYFGTDASGMAAGTGVDGISFFPQSGAAVATIGGTSPADRNLLSGNASTGIRIGSNVLGSDFVMIQGNIIGLARDAATPLANGNHGIDVGGSGPAAVTVGGIGANEGNLISGNAGVGVVVETTNQIATIRGNSIFGNAGKGIQLSQSANTPLPNDAGDADDGGNDGQNFPIVQSVAHLAPSGASTEIVGKLDGTPGTTFDLDF